MSEIDIESERMCFGMKHERMNGIEREREREPKRSLCERIKDCFEIALVRIRCCIVYDGLK